MPQAFNIRDAQLRPSAPAGPKIRARLEFLQSPNYERLAYAGLMVSDNNTSCICRRASCGVWQMLAGLDDFHLISCDADLRSSLAFGEVFASPLVTSSKILA